MNDKMFAALDLEDLTQVSGGCHGKATVAGQMGGDLAMGEMGQIGMGQMSVGQMSMGQMSMGQMSMGCSPCGSMQGLSMSDCPVSPYGGYGVDTPSFEGGMLSVGQPQGAMGAQNIMSFVNSPAFYQTIASPNAWPSAAASLVRPNNDASLGAQPQMSIGGPQPRIA